MKKSQIAEIVVGAVFVGALVLLGVYTIVVKDIGFGGTKEFVVDFERVYGLKEGDPVRVEGHEMGEVKSIRLLPGGEVRAVIEVDDDVEIYREGGEIRVVPFSPLGGRVVEIERGHPTPRGAYEPYTDDLSAERVEEISIKGEAEGELLQSLNSLIEENRRSVNEIVENLAAVSERLTRTDNVLGYLINSEEAKQHVDRVASSLSSSAQRLDRIMTRVEAGEGVIGALVARESPLGRDVTAAVRAGRGALENAENILARADRGESALGVLVSDRPDVRSDVEGIVSDVKHVTGEVAKPEGGGSLSRLVHDDRLYEGAADTFENVAVITERIEGGQGLMGVLFEEESGEHVRQTLGHLASITQAVDDPEAGTLGLLVHDGALRNRLRRIAEEIERLVVEFRDSMEDVREQAPVNAFVGAVFAAF